MATDSTFMEFFTVLSKIWKPKTPEKIFEILGKVFEGRAFADEGAGEFFEIQALGAEGAGENFNKKTHLAPKAPEKILKFKHLAPKAPENFLKFKHLAPKAPEKILKIHAFGAEGAGEKYEKIEFPAFCFEKPSFLQKKTKSFWKTKFLKKNIAFFWKTKLFEKKSRFLWKSSVLAKNFPEISGKLCFSVDQFLEHKLFVYLFQGFGEIHCFSSNHQ